MAESWQESVNAIEAAAREMPEQFHGRSVDLVILNILLRARDNAESRKDYWTREMDRLDERIVLYETSLKRYETDDA